MCEMKNNYIVKTINIHKKRKTVCIFAIIFAIFAFFIMYIKFLVTPLMVDISSSQIKVYGAKSMNYAITETMNQNISYDDLINIVTDSSGKIGMIQANTVKINNVSAPISFASSAAVLSLSITASTP